MCAVKFLPHSLRSAALQHLLLLALLAQTLVPAGFMPGRISDGQFLQLCPEGLSPQVMAALLGDAHHHHHQHHGDSHSVVADCELGEALSLDAATSALTLAAHPGPASTGPIHVQAFALRNLTHNYRIRAPPTTV